MITTQRAGVLLTVFSGLLVAGGQAETPQAPPIQGRLEGRFTAADTGKPVAGAKVRVILEGAGKRRYVEAVSDAEGHYAVEVPIGHGWVFGVFTPAGHYTQDPKTYEVFVTTVAEPRRIKNFVLQPGSPWRVELHGAQAPAGKLPLFSAMRDPDRQSSSSGETIMVHGDAQGKGVISIPTDGGRYRFGGGLPMSPSRYEFPVADLEIDKDFDPRQVQGAPEVLAERKAVRLRDAAGRDAVVSGVDAVVEANQAVLRFHARPVPADAAIAFRSTAVDEAGQPVARAKYTAAFATGPGAAMSQLEAFTDAQGRLELKDVLLPQRHFSGKTRISMIVVKEGHDGAQTKELKLSEVKNAGSGDFGTVVLKPGRTLRGKVIDENDRPLHGAVVTNSTNYFLYGHLRCRTDADGRFVMPDLSYGTQKMSAQYGERGGQTEFKFDDKSGECLINVRLSPKSGIAATPKSGVSATPRPRPAPGAADGPWDLTLPKKEPKYQKEPRYALLVFGPKREQRVWLVLDGTTLYVDRNANGDLTELDERLQPGGDPPKVGNPGMYTRMDLFEFTVAAGASGTSRFKFHHWIRDENFVPTSDFDKKLHASWLELRQENGTLYRQEGLGQGQTPLIFMPKPADAHVCAFDGPLTFAVKMAEQAVLQRGEAGCDLAFHIFVPGRPYRGAEHALHNPLSTKEVPEGAHLQVDIEFPPKAANAEPLHRKYLLKQRC